MLLYSVKFPSNKNIKYCFKGGLDTYLFLLLIEIVYDDTNEEIECEEGPKDDEDNKVQVHMHVVLILRLFPCL